MTSNVMQGRVKFNGVRPLLFDRYAGSNEAKLDPIDKVYWSQEGLAVIPSINVYSGLVAENSKSVCKMYFGKKAKPIGMAIMNQFKIEQFEIPLLHDGKTISQDDFDSTFEIKHHVARINKAGTAIPNPKERPMLDTPWSIEFDYQFIRDAQSDVNWDVMEQSLSNLGMIGLGTYRPLFGGFTVEF